MPHITFLPCGLEGNVPLGTSIIDASEELGLLEHAGLEIPDGCTRQCECCTCKVLIKEGWENLSEMSDEENELLADNGADDDERLSCQAQILGDIVVWYDGS